MPARDTCGLGLREVEAKTRITIDDAAVKLHKNEPEINSIHIDS